MGVVSRMRRWRSVLDDMNLVPQGLERWGQPDVSTRPRRTREAVEVVPPAILPWPIRSRWARVLSPQDRRLPDRLAKTCLGPCRHQWVVKVIQESREGILAGRSIGKPFLQFPSANGWHDTLVQPKLGPQILIHDRQGSGRPRHPLVGRNLVSVDRRDE